MTEATRAMLGPRLPSPSLQPPGFDLNSHPGNFTNTTPAGSGGSPIPANKELERNVDHQPYKGAQSLSCCPAHFVCVVRYCTTHHPPTYGHLHPPPLFNSPTLPSPVTTTIRYLLPSNLTHEKRDNTTRNVTNGFLPLSLRLRPSRPLCRDRTSLTGTGKLFSTPQRRL